MSVLRRKLRREVWSSKGMLLAIASIITVGVACFVMMRSLYHDLSDAQTDYYSQCRMADFWVDLKKAPLAEIQRVADVPGVASFRSRIAFSTTVDIPSVVKPLNGQVLTLPDRPEPVINNIVLRRGSYFTGQQDNQVIVNDAFARERQLAPGDRVRLILNNRRQDLLIVGTAISSEFTYLVSPGSIAPDNEHYGVFWVKRSFADDVFDMNGAANQVVGLFSPEVRNAPQPVLDHIERVLSGAGVAAARARADQTSHLFLESEIEGLGVFATILPGIFLAVAALVLNILLSRLADQQRTVIGALKAIGYFDSQIFVHFLWYGVLVGLGGGLLGCGLGYLGAIGTAQVYRQFFEFPELRARPHLGIYLVGVGISVVCALVGSLHGARSALRLQPAEAMRPKPPASGRRVWVERIGLFWKQLGFAGRMAIRNVLRNRVRTAAGMFAAATGAALLVVGFMSYESIGFLLDFQYEKIQRSDMELTLESARSESVVGEIRALPGVDYAEPVFQLPCTFRNGLHSEQGGITGLVPGARLTTPRDTEGRQLRIPAAGLLLTHKMADLLDARVGDRLRIEPSRGLQRPVEATVVEVAESYLGTSVYASIDFLRQLVDEESAVTGLQLKVNPSPKAMDSLYRELKQLPALSGVNSTADTRAGLEKAVLESQNATISVFILFAGTIFFGSVLNASLVSLAERQREVATLQVLGYGPWQIGNMLFRENLLVSLTGAVLGLPLGWLLYWAMTYWYQTDLMRLPLVSAPWIWGATLVVAVVFTVAAHLVVQRRILRMDWLEALKTME